MPDDPSPAWSEVPLPLPRPAVRLVLTMVLDPRHDRGDVSWHVRDVESGAKYAAASWPIDRARFSQEYCATRFMKALSDAWSACEPF